DAFESEADRMADAVMRMPQPAVQRACPKCEEEERRDTLQRTCPRCEEELRRKASSLQRVCECRHDENNSHLHAKGTDAEPFDASPAVSSYVASSRGGGQPLPSSTRSRFESSFGHDFSAVRVHADSGSHEAATAINALAFTSGSDIHFGSGHYQPGTFHGDHL